MRIRVLNIRRHFDLRQNLRAHLNIQALGSFDFLARFLDVRIPLQGGKHRLVERETGHGSSALAQFG